MTMTPPTPRLACSMLGARQHYEPMLMAQRAGWLSRFFTDLWTPSLQPLAQYIPSKLYRRAVGRYSSELPNEKVRSFPSLGIYYRWAQRQARSRSELYDVYTKVGAMFDNAVASRLREDDLDVFLGFNTASLASLKKANSLGIRTLLTQIDAARTAYDLVAEEEKRFPDLSPDPIPKPEKYFNRIAEEWAVADRVIVNSEWSKAALLSQGVPEQKLSVVPLSYNTLTRSRAREPWQGKLRVLWLGGVSIQKGLAYALEAAEMVKHLPVTFVFAGPLDIRGNRLPLPSNCEYIGAVPRADIMNLYNRNDVFLFPTLSDGFGLTQVEAMAHGLPVIATSNCGDVVEHGKSGFRVPARDGAAIADAIKQFVDVPDLLPEMSQATLDRSKHFHPDRIWEQQRVVILPQTDRQVLEYGSQSATVTQS